MTDSLESERKGRLAAEERLARVRGAMSGETWSMAISRWRVATFGVGPLERSYERALEEFDEMQTELGLLPKDAPSNKILGTFENIDRQKVAKEAADFVIALSAFVADLGFDLATEVAEKHRINSTERTWHSRGDGTGYHVKPVNPEFKAEYPGAKLLAKADSFGIPICIVPQALIDAEKQFVDPKTKNLVVKCEDKTCGVNFYQRRQHRTDDPQCTNQDGFYLLPDETHPLSGPFTVTEIDEDPKE
jgi:hypothetical protein